MFAGVDFPSHFEKDNFSERRGDILGAGVAYDPESLITGGELIAGFTYQNSSRNWKDEEHYLAAVKGWLTTEQILLSAPRVVKGLDTSWRITDK